MPALKVAKIPFKPRARMLLLLGDQLIRDAGIAVFELVKNAYDADSPSATVTMIDVDDRAKGKIVVKDSGTGMDFKTVTEVWLEPGTDYRAVQRSENRRTEEFKRLPLGEKGVGRFAAHKLGDRIHLVSRKHGHPEVVVDIDWTVFARHEYLADVPVTVRERQAEVFTEHSTGTRIEITKLHNAWTRAMARDLHRAVTSISSPFQKKGEFKAELRIPGKEDWLKGLLSVKEVLDYSLFRAHCEIRGRNLKYTYSFVPFPAMDKVRPREVETAEPQFITFDEPDYPQLLRKHAGPIDLDLYIFDREPRVLSLGVADKKGLKEFLDEAGGVRVYRDDIRVYDYGEPGNDWLNLDVGRVNIPTERISNNIVVGAVSLQLAKSAGAPVGQNGEYPENFGLIEKTNREGFVENPTFKAFRIAVQSAVAQIAAERNQDKERIRRAYSGKKPKEPVLSIISELRTKIDEHQLREELGSYVDRIEADYVAIRDRFLVSATAGLSLMVVIHEVDKGIQELVRAVERERVSERVVRLAKHIADLVEGLGALARSSESKRELASELIQTATFNTELRLKAHKVHLTLSATPDFQTKCSRRLIISTIMNLIDNSIWWLRNKWENDTVHKRLYIGTSNDLRSGPSIIIADNGPGFSDPPEYLTQPFFTRKPNGMGLGLHLADQVMKTQGGQLVFPDEGDVTLPSAFDGAVVALAFGDAKWLA